MYGKQFDKLFHHRYVNNCELLQYSQSELKTIWELGSGRKRNGQREGKVTKRLSLVIYAINVKKLTSLKLGVRTTW